MTRPVSLSARIVRITQVIRLFGVVAVAVVVVLSGGARPGAWLVPALAFLFLAIVFVAVALFVEMVRGIL